MTRRVWVITGTSSGLGLATALYALKEGDKVRSTQVWLRNLSLCVGLEVIATVRSYNKFPQALGELGAHPLVLTLESSDEDIENVAKEALSVYGHVDVLVNNAGTIAGGYGPIEELPYVRRPKRIQYFSSYLAGSTSLETIFK